jgi:hypothetical protein
LLNDQWVIEEIREEIKKFLNVTKIKTQPFRTCGTEQRGVASVDKEIQ